MGSSFIRLKSYQLLMNIKPFFINGFQQKSISSTVVYTVVTVRYRVERFRWGRLRVGDRIERNSWVSVRVRV